MDASAVKPYQLQTTNNYLVAKVDLEINSEYANRNLGVVRYITEII
nr:hypothetical protein [Acinetobacter sp. Marseille-Q1620]